MAGLLAGQPFRSRLTGDASLSKRPMKRVIEPLTQMGANVRHVMEQLPPGCPPVVFLKAEPTIAYTTIGIDNAAAARSAVAHLVALGRTRIAHVAGPLEWREARDRRDGWLAALDDAGLEPGPLAVSAWSAAGGASAFAQLLDEDPSIDGLFAASDQIALGALGGR